MLTDKVTCPKCGSAQIITDECYDTIYGENHTVKDLCCGHCKDCGTDLQWSEVYNFVGYDEIEED